MSDKAKKFWTVEYVSPYHEYHKFDTFEAAEQHARRAAYAEGQDYFIMGQVAKAKAPLAVNDVQVEKVKD